MTWRIHALFLALPVYDVATGMSVSRAASHPHCNNVGITIYRSDV